MSHSAKTLRKTSVNTDFDPLNSPPPRTFQFKDGSNPTKTKTNTQRKRSNVNLSNSMIPRSLMILIHPAFIIFVIMVALISMRIYQIATVYGSSPPSRDKPKTLAFSDIDHHALTSDKVDTPGKLLKRVKRHTGDDNSDSNDPDKQKNGETGYEIDDFKRPSNRRAAESSLDDMLLDGETPLPSSQCMSEEVLNELEARQIETLSRKGENAELSEHKEACEITEDCLLVSPFMWLREGEEDRERSCRKRTFLRCDSQNKTCACQDRFDLRWDTETEESTYQWNPITKSCYVRGTNPCKLEVPCAPGTVCRSTVSISYNTPPIQRICECENIEHLIKAGNEDWWYCAEYWQRSWVFDLDNIKRWKHEPFHLYVRMKTFSHEEEIVDSNNSSDPDNPNSKSNVIFRRFDQNMNLILLLAFYYFIGN